ncbi:hypothetical protein MC885_000302 [Smutsia gigantea]|nr:hypothetical protein MC885_000302 [Smutsia gigantea]
MPRPEPVTAPGGILVSVILILLLWSLCLPGTVAPEVCGKPWWSEDLDVTCRWPWVVSLRLEDEHVCGGALTDPSWVVTATHCIQGIREYSVILGTSKLKPTDGMKALLIPVKDIMMHPTYWGCAFNRGHVALLQLHPPAILSKCVQPICLPEPSYNLKVRTQCWVTGWGQGEQHFSGGLWGVHWLLELRADGFWLGCVLGKGLRQSTESRCVYPCHQVQQVDQEAKKQWGSPRLLHLCLAPTPVLAAVAPEGPELPLLNGAKSRLDQSHVSVFNKSGWREWHLDD